MEARTRRRFHEELAALERDIPAMEELAQSAVGSSVDALVRRDANLAREVIADDDEIDRRYLDIERRVLDILALQTPVASDLRLVFVVMHINLHLERVGDQAVNIAKLALATMDLPPDPTMLSHIQEMSDVVGRMLHTSIDAFVQRDLELCLKLPEMDDPVDLLNRGMYRQVVRLASDPQRLEWGIRMNVVARQLE